MISIILPTYNEKENIGLLIRKIFALGLEDLKIIVIDDNSPDGTGKIVDQLSEKYPLEVIHRAKKLGLGSAYIQGFKLALAQGADLILTMDADFSHNPAIIPVLIQGTRQGFAVVIGSRRVSGGGIQGWGMIRRFMSLGAMWFARLFLGLKTRDVTSGFRCYQRKVLKTLPLEKIKSSGYAFMEEIIYHCEKAGFTIKEVPIIFLDRRHGQSKLSGGEIIKFFLTIFRLKFTRSDDFIPTSQNH